MIDVPVRLRFITAENNVAQTIQQIRSQLQQLSGVARTIHVTGDLREIGRVANGVQRVATALSLIARVLEGLSQSANRAVQQLTQVGRTTRATGTTSAAAAEAVNHLGRALRYKGAAALAASTTLQRLNAIMAQAQFVTTTAGGAIGILGLHLDRASMAAWRFVIAAIPFQRLSMSITYGLMSVGMALVGITRAAMQVEQIRVNLESLLGLEEGRAAFEDVRRIAQQTPFAIQDIAKAWQLAAASGLRPFAREVVIAATLLATVQTGAARSVSRAVNAMIDIYNRFPRRLRETYQVIPMMLEVYARAFVGSGERIADAQGKIISGARGLTGALALSMSWGGRALESYLTTISYAWERVVDTFYQTAESFGRSWGTTIVELMGMLEALLRTFDHIQASLARAFSGVLPRIVLATVAVAAFSKAIAQIATLVSVVAMLREAFNSLSITLTAINAQQLRLNTMMLQEQLLIARAAGVARPRGAFMREAIATPSGLVAAAMSASGALTNLAGSATNAATAEQNVAASANMLGASLAGLPGARGLESTWTPALLRAGMPPSGWVAAAGFQDVAYQALQRQITERLAQWEQVYGGPLRMFEVTGARGVHQVIAATREQAMAMAAIVAGDVGVQSARATGHALSRQLSLLLEARQPGRFFAAGGDVQRAMRDLAATEERLRLQTEAVTATMAAMGIESGTVADMFTRLEASGRNLPRELPQAVRAAAQYPVQRAAGIQAPAGVSPLIILGRIAGVILRVFSILSIIGMFVGIIAGIGRFFTEWRRQREEAARRESIALEDLRRDIQMFGRYVREFGEAAVVVRHLEQYGAAVVGQPSEYQLKITEEWRRIVESLRGQRPEAQADVLEKLARKAAEKIGIHWFPPPETPPAQMGFGVTTEPSLTEEERTGIILRLRQLAQAYNRALDALTKFEQSFARWKQYSRQLELSQYIIENYARASEVLTAWQQLGLDTTRELIDVYMKEADATAGLIRRRANMLGLLEDMATSISEAGESLTYFLRMREAATWIPYLTPIEREERARGGTEEEIMARIRKRAEEFAKAAFPLKDMEDFQKLLAEIEKQSEDAVEAAKQALPDLLGDVARLLNTLDKLADVLAKIGERLAKIAGIKFSPLAGSMSEMVQASYRSAAALGEVAAHVYALQVAMDLIGPMASRLNVQDIETALRDIYQLPQTYGELAGWLRRQLEPYKRVTTETIGGVTVKHIEFSMAGAEKIYLFARDLAPSLEELHEQLGQLPQDTPGLKGLLDELERIGTEESPENIRATADALRKFAEDLRRTADTMMSTARDEETRKKAEMYADVANQMENAANALTKPIENTKELDKVLGSLLRDLELGGFEEAASLVNELRSLFSLSFDDLKSVLLTAARVSKYHKEDFHALIRTLQQAQAEVAMFGRMTIETASALTVYAIQVGLSAELIDKLAEGIREAVQAEAHYIELLKERLDLTERWISLIQKLPMFAEITAEEVPQYIERVYELYARAAQRFGMPTVYLGAIETAAQQSAEIVERHRYIVSQLERGLEVAYDAFSRNEGIIERLRRDLQSTEAAIRGTKMQYRGLIAPEEQQQAKKQLEELEQKRESLLEQLKEEQSRQELLLAHVQNLGAQLQDAEMALQKAQLEHWQRLLEYVENFKRYLEELTNLYASQASAFQKMGPAYTMYELQAYSNLLAVLQERLQIAAALQDWKEYWYLLERILDTQREIEAVWKRHVDQWSVIRELATAAEEYFTRFGPPGQPGQQIVEWFKWLQRYSTGMGALARLQRAAWLMSQGRWLEAIEENTNALRELNQTQRDLIIETINSAYTIDELIGSVYKYTGTGPEEWVQARAGVPVRRYTVYFDSTLARPDHVDHFLDTALQLVGNAINQRSMELIMGGY